MDNAKQRHINKINYYKEQLEKTNSKQRKYELRKHIRRMEKDLLIYRSLRGEFNK